MSSRLFLLEETSALGVLYGGEKNLVRIRNWENCNEWKDGSFFGALIILQTNEGKNVFLFILV